MPESSLNKILKKSELDQDLFLFGSEEYQIERALNLILDKFYPNKDDDYNYHVLNSEETTLGSLLDIANSFPMLGDKTTIVCKNFDYYFPGKLKKTDPNFDALKRYFEKKSPTTQLIITANATSFDKLKVAKPSEPYLTIFKSCDSIFYPKMWPDKHPEWLKKVFNHYNINVEYEVLAFIINQTPQTLRDLGNQVEKIITYLGDDNEINLEKVKNIIGAGRSFTVFELQKAIINRDLKKSLEISENISKFSESDLFGLSSILSNFFILVFKYLDFANEGLNKFDLSKKIGTSPYFVNDVIIAARKYKTKEIESIFILLSETDLKLKSTSENKLALIQKLIIDIVK